MIFIGRARRGCCKASICAKVLSGAATYLRPQTSVPAECGWNGGVGLLLTPAFEPNQTGGWAGQRRIAVPSARASCFGPRTVASNSTLPPVNAVVANSRAADQRSEPGLVSANLSGSCWIVFPFSRTDSVACASAAVHP